MTENTDNRVVSDIWNTAYAPALRLIAAWLDGDVPMALDEADFLDSDEAAPYQLITTLSHIAAGFMSEQLGDDAAQYVHDRIARECAPLVAPDDKWRPANATVRHDIDGTATITGWTR